MSVVVVINFKIFGQHILTVAELGLKTLSHNIILIAQSLTTKISCWKQGNFTMKSQVLQYEQQISLLDFWEQFIYNKNNGANAKTTGKGNKNYGKYCFKLITII